MLLFVQRYLHQHYVWNNYVSMAFFVTKGAIWKYSHSLDVLNGIVDLHFFVDRVQTH